MANPYETDLDRNPANYAALTPLGFIARSASVYPARIAVIHGERRYTWRETYARCRRLASALAARGAVSGDTVSVMLGNTPAMVECHFGVPMCGAVLHAINTRLDAGTVAFMLDHAEAKVVIIDREFAPVMKEALARAAVKPLLIDLDDPEYSGPGERLGAIDYEAFIAQGDPDYAWKPPADEWNAISLNYTSGTTGNPKGVVYSHRSTMLHTLASALPDVTGISARDVILPVVPMFHANAWGLNYSAPMVGAKLVFPGPFLDGKNLFEMYEQEGVTFTAGVPTIWLGLLTFMRENKLKFSTLKRATVGGAACPPAIIRAFQDEYGVQMLHGWGMTETSPVGTLNSFKAKHAGLSGEERLALQAKQGRAIFGVQLKIVDGQGKQLPHDGSAFGDLLVRGPWVASGYFKQEGGDVLHRDEDGQKWFPTGDVANIDPDGYLQITDRSKDVIKSGGEWISSIELENVAIGHPSVAEAAVIGVAHPKWDERPLLIVVRKSGVTVTREELLAFYEGKVAKWSQPDDVVFVDSLPHTATGKLLKTKLRQDFAAHRLPA